jgi:hypothetical protein
MSKWKTGGMWFRVNSTNEQEKDWSYVIPSECCTNEQEKDWRYVIPSECCTNEQEKDWRYVIPSEQH